MNLLAKYAPLARPAKPVPSAARERGAGLPRASFAAFAPFLAAFAAGLAVALALAAFAAAPALAQMMLPGALQASPSGEERKPAAPRAGSGVAPPKFSAQKAPTEAAVIGRALARDGSAGALAFQSGEGKTLELTRLSLAGAGIADPAEPCQVDVIADAPIRMQASGRRHGLAHYEVAVEACPFSLDILDGAVLVSRPPGACDFTAADCRVDPAGFWGPPGVEIDEKQVKVLERERGRAEGDMRATFRALLSSAGKDKTAIKQIAADQAGFSSMREVVCRNYAKEEAHGFCALRMTQARVLALQAEFESHAKNKGGAEPRVTKAKVAAPAPPPGR